MKALDKTNPPQCTEQGDNCLTHVTAEFFRHPREGSSQDGHDDTLYQLTDEINNLFGKASENNKNKDRTCLTLVRTTHGLVVAWLACKEKTGGAKGEKMSENEILEFFGIEPQERVKMGQFKLTQHIVPGGGSHWHCTEPGGKCIAPAEAEKLFIHPNLKAEHKDVHDDTLYQLTDEINNLFGKASENNKNKDRALRLVISSAGFTPIWTHLEDDSSNDTKMIELDEKGIEEVFGTG